MPGRSSQSSAEEEGIIRTKLLSFQLYRKPWSTSISSSSKWCASQLWFQPKSTTAAEKKGIGRKRTLWIEDCWSRVIRNFRTWVLRKSWNWHIFIVSHNRRLFGRSTKKQKAYDRPGFKFRPIFWSLKTTAWMWMCSVLDTFNPISFVTWKVRKIQRRILQRSLTKKRGHGQGHAKSWSIKRMNLDKARPGSNTLCCTSRAIALQENWIAKKRKCLC